MTFFYVCGFLLMCSSFALLLGVTPRSAGEDVMDLLCPPDTLASGSRRARGGTRRGRTGARLARMRAVLAAGGRENLFSTACAASAALLAAGIAAGALCGNYLLIPVLAVSSAALPFILLRGYLASFDRRETEELETALSVITTSYVRSEDIVSAVKENLGYLRPPVKDMFRSFLGEATMVNSDVKSAIRSLKGRSGDAVFREWCDALAACQDDRTLKDTLLPVVSRMTDVRIVNGELRTVLSQTRREYWTMVCLVLSNFPILYALNGEWFAALTGTPQGRAVTALCAAVIFVTALLMMKYTRPVRYKYERK